MSAVEAATTGEKTKFNALVKHMASVVYGATGRDMSGVSDEKIEQFAAVARVNRLTPNRPDRRFPNQNQLNNCW